LTIARIFFPRKMAAGDRCTLAGEDRQYVATVLRMRNNERLLLFDGDGCEYEAVIRGQDQERVQLEIVRKTTVRQNALQITLAQSLPKAKKMDFIIEKACELGATRIVPFFSSRSVPHLTPDKTAAKQIRWQKIAREAARKSHSTGIPEVSDVMNWENMLRLAENSGGERAEKIIFWEEETRINLKQVLRDDKSEPSRNFFLIVGPEGGFAREEIELAERMGFTSVSLGRQILKVETAALAILAIIQYERGIFASGAQEEGGL
jgi:16S rRNA (uracil1498-N3)-methyltransferase